MGCFTHYWEGKTCQRMFEDGSDGRALDHTAGNLFTQRGVIVGDRVYVVNVVKGILKLIGRLEVGKIVSMAEAEKLMGYEVWDAPEHLVAKKGTATPMRFKREVPLNITKELLFEGTKSYEPLKFVSEGILDRQTLRGVRRLTDASAHLLESLLP